MSSKSTFGLLFFLNRTKQKKNGECPVMLRITINGQKLALQVKRFIKPEHWDVSKHRMIGRSAEAQVFNEYIEAVKLKAHKKYNELHTMYDEVSPQMLRDAILGVNSAKPKMLLEIWEEHNASLKKLIGKENSYATFQKFTTAKNHVQTFLQKKYQVNDVSIKQVNFQLINEFSLYLKSEKNCGNNTTTKFLQNFKRIITIALRSGWIMQDPFVHINMSIEEVDRPYLTQEELTRLLSIHSPFDRINRVRDFFAFSCFTGLAYIDIKQLTRKEIEENENGTWIRTHRQKTGVRSNVPLLDIPKSIINKYTVLEALHPNDKVLPIISNQKMNAYLKELADLCKIGKDLTFHVARHTFATTVTMTNGVPIETVSKMLGHKKIATTQHYARIVDKKVEEDMNVLANKLTYQFSATN
jgi:site-specific recombinase XerD